MPMLTNIELQHFKCFKELTSVEIKPLTVLCGINSSGKSSIIKSLLTLKQSYENESPYNEMLFNGEYVDNGFFEDVMFNNGRDIDDVDCFLIKNTFVLTNMTDDSGYSPIKRQDITSFKELRKIYGRGSVHKFVITSEIEVANKNENRDTIEYFVENNYLRRTKITIQLLNEKNEPIEGSLGSIEIKKINNIDDRNYNIKIENIPDGNRQFSNINFNCTCYFSNMHLSNIYQNNMRQEVKDIRPVLLSLTKIVSLQYKGIDFIAPLRQHPKRNYVINSNINSVGVYGEDAPMLLAKIMNKDAASELFCPFVSMCASKKEKLSYLDIIQSWMNYLKLGELKVTNNNNLVNINVSGHNIVDVGFGISQTLPILIQGLYMSKDQTLLLEQPEIHLHPEMQLNLADFFISLAQNERNIIVETHSDHFVNRIVHRIMENYELKKFINIIFVQKDEDGASNCTNIQIDKCNGIKDEFPNFFTQYGTETKQIIDTGLKNMLEYINNENNA